MIQGATLRCDVRACDGGRIKAALTAAGISVTETDPEVIVVAGGFEAVRDAASGDARVVALVDRVDRRAVAALLDLGAAAVAAADTEPDVVAALVRAVGADFTIIPMQARQTVKRPSLTARQKQILAMVVLGLTNAEIAERLFIAEVTVKTHLTRIFTELGVRSRKEAVALIHDPTSGLGPGILGIPEAARLQQGYGRPKFGS